jgi:hypothetical protein
MSSSCAAICWWRWRCRAWLDCLLAGARLTTTATYQVKVGPLRPSPRSPQVDRAIRSQRHLAVHSPAMVRATRVPPPAVVPTAARRAARVVRYRAVMHKAARVVRSRAAMHKAARVVRSRAAMHKVARVVRSRAAMHRAARVVRSRAAMHKAARAVRYRAAMHRVARAVRYRAANLRAGRVRVSLRRERSVTGQALAD